MIKVYALLPKRADVSEDYFHKHWSTVHLDHARRIDRLRRYVQSHVQPVELEGLETARYDGIPEVWYDSHESAVGQGSDPNYTEYAQKDEPNFVDMDRIAWVHTDDVLVEAGPDLPEGWAEEPHKVILMLKRTEDVSPEDFAGSFGEVAREALAMPSGVTRSAYSIAVPEMYEDGGDPTYDGFLEFWFEGEEELTGSWASSGDDVLAALDELIEPDESNICVTRELRVIWP